MELNPLKILRRLVRMGRLSGDDPRPRPYQSPGIMAPAVKKTKKAVAVITRRAWRACDRCGYSQIDGQAITRAKWQVEVNGGTLYFCGHHFREFSDLIMTAGYPIFDIREKVAAK